MLGAHSVKNVERERERRARLIKSLFSKSPSKMLMDASSAMLRKIVIRTTTGKEFRGLNHYYVQSGLQRIFEHEKHCASLSSVHRPQKWMRTTKQRRTDELRRWSYFHIRLELTATSASFTKSEACSRKADLLHLCDFLSNEDE